MCSELMTACAAASNFMQELTYVYTTYSDCPYFSMQNSCKHTHIHGDTHTYTHTHTHTLTHTNTHTHAYTHTNIHTHTQSHTP